MSFSGCEEDDGSGYTFRMNLSGNPQNLDPQLAEDISSKIIINNMMDGLVRISDMGTIELNAAQSYSISDDELTYVFELKDNVYWESVNGFKAQMTADDFVFAFQRIFDSEALFSPYVDDFICIKNASAVSKGEMDKSDLGVKALDEFTLRIELEYPYYDFLEQLATTAAMPCNRAFFESTKGRYGLDAENSVSNGAFYLKEWNYDAYWDNNYIIMRRNKSNSEQDYVYPYSLNFFILSDSSEDQDDFSSGDIDCMITDDYDRKLFSKNNYTAYSVKSYGLVFNTNSQYFGSKDIRYALASSFNREVYGSLLDERYSVAYGIVPNSVKILGRNYRDIISDSSMSIYDKSNAQALWNKEFAMSNIVSIDGIKITIPEDFGGAEYIDYITEQWQENLDFYCGTEVVSQNEYELKLSEGSFDIVLVEIDGSGVNDYFEYFTSDFTDISGYRNYAVTGYLQTINKASSLSEASRLYTQAEKQIIENAVYIPLFYGNKYFVCSDTVQDISYISNSGEVNFRYAKSFD